MAEGTTPERAYDYSLDAEQDAFLAAGWSRLGVAWIVGVFVYLFAMAVTVYDGPLSLIFQPIIGAIVSGIVTFASFVVGLLLWLPYLRRVWHKTVIGRVLATALIVAGAVMFVYAFTGERLVLVHLPDSPETIHTSNSRLGAPGYIMLIFGIANWPDGRSRSQ